MLERDVGIPYTDRLLSAIPLNLQLILSVMLEPTVPRRTEGLSVVKEIGQVVRVGEELKILLSFYFGQRIFTISPTGRR